MYTQHVNNIEHFQKVLTYAKHAKGRFDILIDKAISLFCDEVRVVPLYQQILIALAGLLYQHQEDVALISQPQSDAFIR